MQFIKEIAINASPERVFRFHELPDALERLMPPWETSVVVKAAPDLKVGSRTVIDSTVFGPFKVRWVAEHTAYDRPRMFEDTQLKGPFKQWRHRRIIIPSPTGTILRDELLYEPPLWFLGRMAAPFFITPRL